MRLRSLRSWLICQLLIIFSLIWLTNATIGDNCTGNGDCGTNEVCSTDQNLCSCSAGYHDSDGDNSCTACEFGYFKSTIGEQACTQVRTKGYFAVDGSGTSVNTAAVDQEICTVGTFSAAGATACTTAQQGYYTVDANGDALSDPWQGAVAEAQAGEGFFTVDQNGDAADSGR